MSDLKIRNKGLVRLKVADVQDNPNNYNRHPDAQRKAFRAAVDEVGFFGYPDVYLTDDGTYRLIDGEMRKTDLLDEYGAETEIEFNVTDFNEAEADLALATKDPLAAMARRDGEALNALLGKLQVEDGDLRDFLNSQVDDRALLQDLGDETIPAPPDEAITQPGDVWILGDHRLMCGDSTNEDDLQKLLGTKKVALVNTAPPYNVDYTPQSNNAVVSGEASLTTFLKRSNNVEMGTDEKMRPKDRRVENDNLGENYPAFCEATVKAMAAALKKGGSFYVWSGWSSLMDWMPLLSAKPWLFHQLIVWRKNHPTPSRKAYMQLGFETCLFGWKTGAAHKWNGPNNARDVWDVKKVHASKMVHTTEKPIELATIAISNSTKAGDRVLDLFAGSGSTLIACQQLKRIGLGMELDPLYCDVIVQRWENLTDRKAKRCQ